MTDIWVAAAWVVPIFAGASGALLFGYLWFFRRSQADDRQAANGDAAVRAMRPLGRMTGWNACMPVAVAGDRAA